MLKIKLRRLNNSSFFWKRKGSTRDQLNCIIKTNILIYHVIPSYRYTNLPTSLPCIPSTVAAPAVTGARLGTFPGRRAILYARDGQITSSGNRQPAQLVFSKKASLNCHHTEEDTASMKPAMTRACRFSQRRACNPLSTCPNYQVLN